MVVVVVLDVVVVDVDVVLVVVVVGRVEVVDESRGITSIVVLVGKAAWALDPHDASTIAAARSRGVDLLVFCLIRSSAMGACAL
ncbi:MAG: hypothetical protein HKN91_09710 [Acidimicrobiia bacterium]|nr:hypothetical protein [Acidimicrobiia bacterium]